MRICPSLHGGALDHPKITSMSIGEVMQKWDFCFEKVQSEATNQNENNGKALPPTMNSDDEVYEKLTGLKINSNSCPSDQNSSFSDLGSRDTPEEFFSAVSESSSKLTIYNTDFIKDLLGQGEMASLLPILSGMNFKVRKYVICNHQQFYKILIFFKILGLALMRNKVWIYNQVLIVDGKAKPFNDIYKELQEVVESTLTQLVEYQSTLMATTILHDAGKKNS